MWILLTIRILFAERNTSAEETDEKVNNKETGGSIIDGEHFQCRDANAPVATS